MAGKALAKKQPNLGHITVHLWLCQICWEAIGKPDFLIKGLARCQGCGRSVRWVNVWWVTIKLPKVVP